MYIHRKKVLIACDSSRTLLGFRGKLIEELVKKNEVHVFTPTISQQEVSDKLNDLKVIVHENELNGSNVSIFSDLKYISKLYSLIKTIKPDVFFPYTFKPVIYGTVIAKFCKVNCITPMLTGLGYNFTSHGVKKSLVSTITKSLLKWSLLRSDHLKIIFQNADDYHKLIETGIISNQHQAFVVNGSGVDLEHYDYSIPDTKNINFLMISRLINAKGIKEFYEAAKLVRQKYSNISFKLIGAYDDNIDSINKELYASIKSDQVIEYLGEVNDVRPHIKQASILVLPSYYGEGVPRCMLEGMAMGRALITCDSVGCRETVDTSTEKPNGFLIPIKNIDELVLKMEHYINNIDDILNYGLNGRSFAKQKFDVNLVNAEMLKIMQVN
ncbi:glycosyltransferase family 4 protein [Pedobacter sp. PLR]|uniref:glycosyltransferase family 4 protein n=1 Tax=Pedobacter sp. PLR TaxID=2994465 RepID=UPI0022456F32|nr:glycosyltransferase family 4 protein [Pedobacter sp. PLR]MCX2449921.1 glycosyltransferase family 4 protein [Pedobacter sp. PLR]